MIKENTKRITMAHGGGGILMKELIGFIVEKLGGDRSSPLQDSAVLGAVSGRIAFTTDSFVVDPLFFPGGDIGRLSVCGTANALAVCGAVPIAISLSFIIEEGFPTGDLGRILDSIRSASEEAGVRVVTGDTKVVEKGKADGIFINTSGIGTVPDGIELSSASAKPGDAVIVNGTLGDHGLAIMSLRENLDFGSGLESDTAPLSTLTVPLLRETEGIRAMRDATRGGLAAVLNEIAGDSEVCIHIDESSIPLKEAVRKGCELMGYEPLHIANEGKFVVIVDPAHAETVLERIRRDPLGKEAAIIGSVRKSPERHVIMKTAFGGERVVDLPYGDLLPRIC